MIKRVLGSIWFWWVLLTAAYLILFDLFLNDGSAAVGPTMMAHVTGFLGLFVPFGAASLLLFIFGFPLSVISVAVFFGGAVIVNNWLKKKNFSLGVTILLILLALFLLTFATDASRGMPLAGFKTFLQGHTPDFE